MARRRQAIYKSQTAITHAGTLVDNIGNSSVPQTMEFADTVAARTTTGASQAITSNRGTDELCNTGDTIKYVNLFIQASPRADIELPADKTGWLEYAVVLVKDTETKIPNTSLGTETLGVVATRMFRNECIWTGNFPVGEKQPNSVNLQIKIPRFKQRLRIWDQWILYTSFRSAQSTSTSTIAVRVISSFIYKAYS